MSTQSTPIIVFGASGRVGSRICALAMNDPSFTLVAAIVRDGSALAGRSSVAGRDDAPKLVNTGEFTGFGAVDRAVLIDFSSDDGTREALSVALSMNASLLVGTTALSDPTMASMRAAAGRAALLITPNTSFGVAALSAAVQAVARSLGAGFDLSIVESHHAMKKDSPSGTALRLARAAREAGALLRDDQIVSTRGGDVIGEHTVRFAGPGEYLELTHLATSREVFALGALRAAAWLSGRAPGLYTMEDALGLPA
jgi:4-hydroxy-tetrahydrodipicolinate reductase